jgi:hypothetical protein
MYFNFLGGSALLHLLAAHPKVVVAFGIATTVGMLSTSLGPQNVVGVGQQMRALERSITQHVADAEIPAVTRVAGAADTRTREEMEHDIRYSLAQCGKGCRDLTPAAVMRDAKLVKDALYLASLDRGRRSLPSSGRELARVDPTR